MARPRTCSVKYFCLGAFLIFLGSVLLCALGFTIVLPHEATRLWPEVTCHVTNTSYDMEHCACDQQVMEYDNCIDKYPCLKVSVVYNSSKPEKLQSESYNHTSITQKLHRNQFNDTGFHYHELQNQPKIRNRNHKEHIMKLGMLYRKWSDSFHRTCALYECGDELWNVKEVKKFKKEWGHHGKAFPCFFDPDNPGVLVLERTQKLQVIHAILWPALSLFTGSLIWLGMCFGCWKIEIEQPQTSSTYYRGIL